MWQRTCHASRPRRTSSPLSHERLTEILAERGLGANLQSMGESVASNTSDLISTAMGMIGIPYRFGGTNAETGFDCSGFVRAIYQEAVGHVLPRNAREQAKATQKIDKKTSSPVIWCSSTPCAELSAMSAFMWVMASSSMHHGAAKACAWKA